MVMPWHTAGSHKSEDACSSDIVTIVSGFSEVLGNLCIVLRFGNVFDDFAKPFWSDGNASAVLIQITFKG